MHGGTFGQQTILVSTSGLISTHILVNHTLNNNTLLSVDWLFIIINTRTEHKNCQYHIWIKMSWSSGHFRFIKSSGHSSPSWCARLVGFQRMLCPAPLQKFSHTYSKLLAKSFGKCPLAKWALVKCPGFITDTINVNYMHSVSMPYTYIYYIVIRKSHVHSHRGTLCLSQSQSQSARTWCASHHPHGLDLHACMTVQIDYRKPILTKVDLDL